MTYPALSRRRAQELADALLAAIEAGDDPIDTLADEKAWGVEERDGCDYDRLLVRAAAAAGRKALWDGKSNCELGEASETDKYRLESEMAETVHQTLCELDMRCLEDEAFWRYLALFPFRWYLLAREPELQPQDFGGQRKKAGEDGVETLSGTDFNRQLLFRTFLWGQAAYDESGGKEQYERATKVPAGGPIIDIWHSHMIRTQIGRLGAIPTTFIDVVVGSDSDTNAMKPEARELAKLVTRMKHNVLLDVYPAPGAEDLLAEQLILAKELCD